MKPNKPTSILKSFGIGKNCRNAIIKALDDESIAPHNAPISFNKMVEETSCPREDIKKAFFVLLIKQYLKARYVPYHRSCGTPIGETEISADNIKNNFEEEVYPDICPICDKEIEEFEDIDIKMFFQRTKRALR